MKKYIIKLSKCKTVEVVLKIKELINMSKEKNIQQALVNLGNDIIVDGIIGHNTVNAICKTRTNSLLKELDKLEVNEFKLNEKESILSYLAKEEGDYYHWNKGEHTYTTPYGVYKYANPKSKIIKFSDKLIKKYKIYETKQGIKKLNSFITQEERRIIRDLAYELYKKKYINNNIDKILIGKDYKHTRISIFSFSVNAGLSRAMFKLQQTIGAYPDGLIGDESIGKLRNCRLSDNELNIRYLNNIKRYYDTLISEDPDKYSIFKNGWYNRLRRLGLKI